MSKQSEYENCCVCDTKITEENFPGGYEESPDWTFEDFKSYGVHNCNKCHKLMCNNCYTRGNIHDNESNFCKNCLKKISVKKNPDYICTRCGKFGNIDELINNKPCCKKCLDFGYSSY
jgi:hypothetical protein